MSTAVQVRAHDRRRHSRTALAAAAGNSFGEALRDWLRLIRLYLGMSVAVVAEFREGERHFRYVDAEENVAPIREGDATPLSGTYCAAIVEGAPAAMMPQR